MGLKERLKKLRDEVVLALKPAQESIIEIAKRERSVQERFPTGFEETGIPTSKEFQEGFRAVGGGSSRMGTTIVSERTGLSALEIAMAQERLRRIEIAEQQKRLREGQIKRIEEARRRAEIRIRKRQKIQREKELRIPILERLKEKIPKRERIKRTFRKGLMGLRQAIPKDLSLGTGQFIRDPKTGKLKQVTLRDATKKLFKNLEKKGFSKQRIAGFTTLSDKKIDRLKGLSPKEKENLKTISKLQREVIVGGLKEIEEKPENIIAIAALGRVSPGAIKSIGGTKTAVKIIKKIPKSVQRKGAKAILRFLTGAYLTSAGIRVVKEPTPEARAQKLGRILIGEVVPFEIGTKLGVKGLLKQELRGEINKAVKGMSKTRQQAFRDYMKQAQTFGKYEPEARNIKLNNIESIKGTKAQKTVRNFLKRSKGKLVVGGSVAQTGQIKVGRKLGDMDLYIDGGKISPTGMAKKLASELRKAGVKKASSIGKEVRIAGKKSVEFHNIDRLLTNIEQVTPIWSRAKSYIIKTPEGIRIQRIGLQARRKVIAAFADPKRLKTGKYRKDLKDFKKISDQIFKNAVKKSKSSFFFKKKKIKQIEKIFKRKVRIKFPKIKKIIRKPKLAPKQLQRIRLKSLEKARAKLKLLRKRKIKIKVKKIKPKKPLKKPKIKKRIKPSQKRIKKIKRPKIIPSQPPRKRKKIKKIPPSQRPVKKPPKKRIPKRPPKRPTRRIPPSQPPVKKPPVKRPPVKPLRVPVPPRKPPRPPKKPPILPIIKKRKKPKKLKLKVGYDVFGKRLKGRKIKGKKRKVVWIKLNVKPLTKTHAQNRGAYAIDHSVARTFKIKRVRKVKRVGKITKKEGKYFKKTKKKYRPFKIRKGVKKPIVRKWIERRGKHLIDTRGEKRGLKLAQIKKQLIQPRTKRRITKKFKRPKVLKKRVALGNKGGRVTGGKGKISKTITRSKPKPIKKKRFIKGSKEAKQFMAKLRRMRG